MRRQLGRVLVGAEDHLDRVGGSTDADATVRGREHVNVGYISAMRGAQFDQGVGYLAGGESGERRMHCTGTGRHGSQYKGMIKLLPEGQERKASDLEDADGHGLGCRGAAMVARWEQCQSYARISGTMTPRISL